MTQKLKPDGGSTMWNSFPICCPLAASMRDGETGVNTLGRALSERQEPFYFAFRSDEHGRRSRTGPDTPFGAPTIP